MQKDSLIRSAVRSFLVAGFAVLGIFAAVAGIAAISFSDMATNQVEQDNKVVILPDAEGVRTELSNDVPVVLQVNVEGIIGLDKLTSKHIRNQLIESREGELKDNRVKAILLNINTPGGTVLDGDGIYRTILEYKKRYNVPVIAYVDGLCASGGMYVASSADAIYASNTSLIGSVGVILPSSLNFSKLMEKIGIEQKTIFAGKGKDELNPLRPWKPEEGKNYQHLTDYYYDRFVDIVTSNRPKLNREKLIQEYGAKVFPAPQAEQIGYIDGSGYEREDVVKMLLKQANIPEGDEYQVITLEDKNWIHQLFNSSAQTALFSGKMKHQIQWNSELDPQLEGKFLYLYKQ